MIYLDNASTTRMDNRVLEAMMPYLTEEYGNAGTIHSFGRRAAEAVQTAREQVACLIGAGRDQIVFTAGGSEANNLAIRGSAGYLERLERSSVAMSPYEHDSANRACKAAYDEWYCFSGDGRVSVDDVKEVLSNHKIGLAVVMHTNNETGLVNPVKEIAEICHRNNTMLHVDAVQAVSCHQIDVKEIGCDFLSLSSHKIHGPKGVGALYIKDRCTLAPLICGGSDQEFGLRGGTENVAGIVGFGKACELLRKWISEDGSYLTELVDDLYQSIRQGLIECGLEGVVHLNGVEPTGNKILNLRFDGIDGETLVLALDAVGICASAGSACRSHEQEPSRVLIAMGLTPEEARSSIRFSVSKINTREEMAEAGMEVAKTVRLLLGKD